ncbi:jg335 [Pararge aegeria aegeria]|uniref:Jg335 protein n=1 Tax=Pararge aegeria aegeria TaxID=348720 RepID=A0A8S4QPE9_9NEOP|nr:jg335 [Pararge aegeria aegeria]
MTYSPIALTDLIRALSYRISLCAWGTGSPWLVRNVDLHRDLDLPTIAQYFKKISKSYFEKAVRHPNPLVVEASTYTPALDVEPRRRRRNMSFTTMTIK